MKRISFKKTLLTLATISSVTIFSMSSALAADPTAGDGKINFTGEILDTACTVETNSQNLTVPLGKVAKSVFTGAGSTAATKEFIVKLAGCPAGLTATIRFDGVADSYRGDNSVLQLTSGGASGVGVEILDAQNNPIKLYEDSNPLVLVAGDNNMTYKARYIATSSSVTAGVANATANFTVVYQ